LLQHGHVQPAGPAKTLQPGQELPGSNGLSLLIQQSGKHLVMQYLATGLGAVYRLHIELQAPLLQRLVEQLVPALPLIYRGLSALFGACPAAITLRQRL